MARKRFDPTLALGGKSPEPPDSPSADRPLMVSQVGELVRSVLEMGIPGPIRVIGEVSNLNARNHWYFSLKDENAVIQCVAWASTAAKLGPAPADGEQIIARGTISHYPPQGKTQLYVTAIERVGAGLLEQKFRALCEDLRRLGYFDEARKKPLPVFPRRVAVITSKTSAAVRDVIATMNHRCKAVELLIVDVRVQGEGSAAQVAGAIRWVDSNRVKLGVDAMIVTRGGGSIEDLWAFNERIVADAVFGASLPVVAAIGHESDITIIELVADVRAATPTQAAMRLCPDGAELLRQVEFLSSRLRGVMGRRVELERRRVDGLARSEILRRPKALIDRHAERLRSMAAALRQSIRLRLANESHRIERLAVRLRPDTTAVLQQGRLDALAARLDRAMQSRIGGAEVHLRALERHLAALGPESILSRGFSYTMKSGGGLVRSIADVGPGEGLETRVADGVIHSVVGGTATRRRAQKGLPAADQMDLFEKGG